MEDTKTNSRSNAFEQQKRGIKTMMKRLSDEEIKKIKTDFVRGMNSKVYKKKKKIKEDLISYRDMFSIRDEMERLFVNQMIISNKNIPDELIGVWKGKKVGRKSKNAIKLCDVCETPLENENGQRERILKTFNNSFLSPMREVKLKQGQEHCPNVNCCNYNQIGDCS